MEEKPKIIITEPVDNKQDIKKALATDAARKKATPPPPSTYNA